MDVELNDQLQKVLRAADKIQLLESFPLRAPPSLGQVQNHRHDGGTANQVQLPQMSPAGKMAVGPTLSTHSKQPRTRSRGESRQTDSREQFQYRPTSQQQQRAKLSTPAGGTRKNQVLSSVALRYSSKADIVSLERHHSSTVVSAEAHKEALLDASSTLMNLFQLKLLGPEQLHAELKMQELHTQLGEYKAGGSKFLPVLLDVGDEEDPGFTRPPGGVSDGEEDREVDGGHHEGNAKKSGDEESPQSPLEAIPEGVSFAGSLPSKIRKVGKAFTVPRKIKMLQEQQAQAERNVARAGGISIEDAHASSAILQRLDTQRSFHASSVKMRSGAIMSNVGSIKMSNVGSMIEFGGNPVASSSGLGNPVMWSGLENYPTSSSGIGHPVTSASGPGHPATSASGPGHPATSASGPGHPVSASGIGMGPGSPLAIGDDKAAKAVSLDERAAPLGREHTSQGALLAVDASLNASANPGTVARSGDELELSSKPKIRELQLQYSNLQVQYNEMRARMQLQAQMVDNETAALEAKDAMESQKNTVTRKEHHKEKQVLLRKQLHDMLLDLSEKIDVLDGEAGTVVGVVDWVAPTAESGGDEGLDYHELLQRVESATEDCKVLPGYESGDETEAQPGKVGSNEQQLSQAQERIDKMASTPQGAGENEGDTKMLKRNSSVTFQTAKTEKETSQINDSQINALATSRSSAREALTPIVFTVTPIVTESAKAATPMNEDERLQVLSKVARTLHVGVADLVVVRSAVKTEESSSPTDPQAPSFDSANPSVPAPPGRKSASLTFKIVGRGSAAAISTLQSLQGDPVAMADMNLAALTYTTTGTASSLSATIDSLQSSLDSTNREKVVGSTSSSGGTERSGGPTSTNEVKPAAASRTTQQQKVSGDSALTAAVAGRERRKSSDASALSGVPSPPPPPKRQGARSPGPKRQGARSPGPATSRRRSADMRGGDRRVASVNEGHLTPKTGGLTPRGSMSAAPPTDYAHLFKISEFGEGKADTHHKPPKGTGGHHKPRAPSPVSSSDEDFEERFGDVEHRWKHLEEERPVVQLVKVAEKRLEAVKAKAERANQALISQGRVLVGTRESREMSDQRAYEVAFDHEISDELKAELTHQEQVGTMLLEQQALVVEAREQIKLLVLGSEEEKFATASDLVNIVAPLEEEGAKSAKSPNKGSFFMVDPTEEFWSADFSETRTIGTQTSVARDAPKNPQGGNVPMVEDAYQHEELLFGGFNNLTVAVSNIAQFHSDLEVDISCKSCLKIPRQPRTLWPCGHTFCADCLTAMYKDAETVECGECGRFTDTGYTPNDILESITIQAQAGVSTNDGSASVGIHATLKSLMKDIASVKEQVSLSYFDTEDANVGSVEEILELAERLMESDEVAIDHSTLLGGGGGESPLDDVDDGLWQQQPQMLHSTKSFTAFQEERPTMGSILL